MVRHTGLEPVSRAVWRSIAAKYACRACAVAPWTPDQVRGDERGNATPWSLTGFVNKLRAVFGSPFLFFISYFTVTHGCLPKKATTTLQKNAIILLPATAALILVGFIQPLDQKGFVDLMFIGRVVYLLDWSAPILPAAMVLLRFARPRPASPALVWPIAIIVFLIGLSLTFFSSAFASNLSLPLMVTQGSVLSLAVASGILSLAIGHSNSNTARLAMSGMVLSAVAAIWSLLSVPAAVFQANQTAASHPFCIAHHGSSADVDSLWDLRGFSFYTTATGYKSTSTWYFHGILIVEGNDGLQYFNWSPRHFRFDRIDHPERYIASLNNLCVPTSAFWKGL
ncbi:hypothetical protein [Martelella mangrovi]|uniref:Uncharacterized protein n=1 Tax=Martelella mangrovi TaxID=1397477 RepID=A0ABV2I840_9HYPH